MLIIRLQRVGKTNSPSFRAVVTDSKRTVASGKYLEIVGFYDPKSKKTALKNDRIKYWIMKGAQISPTVHNLLVKNKVIEASKINVVKAAKPEKK